MAQPTKLHNLTNFPALLELPNTTKETVKAKEKVVDAEGNPVLDEKGKPTTTERSYESPKYSAEDFSKIVEILGKENICAILSDEAKVVYRNAKTPEQLRQDAINAMIRAGLSKEVAEAAFS